MGSYYEVKRKSGSIWKVIFRPPETYVYQKFDNEMDAADFYEKTKKEIEWEAAKKLGHKATLPASGDLLDERLADTIELFLESGKCGDGGLGNLPTVLKHIGDVTNRELSESWIEDYIDHMRDSLTRRGDQFSYSTIQKHCVNMKLALKWRAKKLGVPRPPFDFSVKMFPEDWENERERRLEKFEERMLARHFRKMDGPGRLFWRLLMRFAIETGARQSEMVDMPWSELKIRNGREFWLLPKKRTKSKRTRVIPLTKRAVKVLAMLRKLADPSDPRVFHFFSGADVVSALFHRAVVECGIVDFRFHDLRHEGISRFVLHQRKFTVDQIMKIMGHRTREMLDRYTNLRGDELAALLV